MLNSLLLQITTTGTDSVVRDTVQQAINTPVQEAPPQVTISLFDLLMKGGIVMIPLALLLLIALYVIIERALAISKAAKTDKNFMNNIRDFILNGNIDAAKSLCRNSTGASARVIEKGISRIGKPLKEIDEAIENVAALEVHKMEKHLAILSIIGRIAPMLGFIGTILGVITIFYDISLSNTISIDVIAGGLYQKMITSATGLVIGVIAFVGYHWLILVVDKVVHRMEHNAVEFIDLLHEPTK